MKKLVYCLLVVSSIAFSQSTREVGEFTKVTSFDQIDVFLIKSDENKVVLDGKDAQDVELINKKGELKIRMPLTKMLSGDDISVTVYYKNITAVEANEGSRIACGDKIKTSSFDIIAKEGSEVKLNLQVEKLNARVANGSKIYLDGEAIKQYVIVNSGGIYEAETFKTVETKITTNAGGLAFIFATDLLDAKIRAGGNISIFSKPKEFIKEVIAGGTFTFIEKAK
jgi:hypothetical protein